MNDDQAERPVVNNHEPESSAQDDDNPVPSIQDVNDLQSPARENHEIASFGGINCIICAQPMKNEVGSKKCIPLSKRGIDTLCDSSRRKRDKLHTKIKDLKELWVHDSCRANYNRFSFVGIQSNQKSSNTRPPVVSTRSRENEEFIFETSCLFCGLDAGPNFVQKQQKCRLDKRRKVSIVKSTETIDCIKKICKERSDEEGDKVLSRILSASDLVAVNARYHYDCYPKFTKYRFPDKDCSSSDTEIDKVTQFIVNYITENDEECQFSLNELIKKSDVEVTRVRSVKDRLHSYFRDNIVFTSVRNDLIITYIDRSRKILNESWYKQKCKNDLEERQRIVQTAAKIILEDIHEMVYDTEQYKAPSNFLENVFSDVPQTLKLLLDGIIKTKKRDSSSKKWDTRVCFIAHSIIASARPRTFISQLQLALSSMLHKQHASRKLIDNLFHLGMCASYEETVLFEASIVYDPIIYTFLKAYIQFVFDNADHNSLTVDGHGTTHVLAGVKIVTPSSSVQSQNPIQRLKKLPAACETGKFGYMGLQKYSSPSNTGLKNVKMEAVGHEPGRTPLNSLNTQDLTWLYGKGFKAPVTKGWNVFMEMLASNVNDVQKSRIISLPIINNPPSDLDTVYTALMYADQEAKKIGQKHVFVTGDHPIFMKYEFILENRDKTRDDLSRVIGRIGIFHLQMSLSHSVSSTMDGSGLREILELVYASNSIDAMLSGKAHDRAMRAHRLVLISLATLIFQETQFPPEEIAHLETFLDNLENPECDLQSFLDDDLMKSITSRFLAQCRVIEKRSSTAKLWIQYFTSIVLLFKINEADKRGDWYLHLKSVRHVLPIFHATAHLNYAKATHLYLQKMMKLEGMMDPQEYNLFTKEGYWTTRRFDDHILSGNPTDLIIEQVFMRSMKTAGGLTRGRGISEGVVAKWIMSMIVVTDVTYAMEQFCNYAYVNSEQSLQDREASIRRDAQDLHKIACYLSTHNPFDVTETECVVSVSTGLKGDARVNCHQVFEIGSSLLLKTYDKKFDDIKLQRKHRVISLGAAQSSVVVDNDSIRIDPTLLFQRLTMTIEKKEDMKEHLKLELAPYPKALFDQNGMSKTPKHKFIDNFMVVSGMPNLSGASNVVDGGFLLHRVTWQQNEIVDNILQNYVDYVGKHFSQDTSIIFDGYPEVPQARHIKSLERARRMSQKQAQEFAFDRTSKISTTKDKFLLNEKNKKRLITMLMEKLEAEGYKTLQAEEDADILIVQTAINLSRTQKKPSIIVGEDIDLLVILNQMTSENDQIDFFKPGKKNSPDKFFTCNSFRPQHLSHLVAFFHAFCGCDTVSSIHGKGKNAIVKLFQNKSDLIPLAESFNNADTPKSVLYENGMRIMAKLYDAECDSCDLDDMRYKLFRKKTTKISFKLENLPPTKKAAMQHSLRTYLQVQLWLGNETITATDYGWYEAVTPTNTRCLKPKYVHDNVLVPPDLMKQISCSCKTGCKSKSCSCVKLGVPCTDLCSNCHGYLCKNITDFVVEVPTDDPNVDAEARELLNPTNDIARQTENHRQDEEILGILPFD